MVTPTITMPIMVIVSYSQMHHNPSAHMSIVCVRVYVWVCVRDVCVYCVGICVCVCVCACFCSCVCSCVRVCVHMDKRGREIHTRICIREGEKYTG